MKFFLSPQQNNVKNDEEKHSNQWTVINNIALEVGLFFASVANNDISGFCLNNLLFLFTGMERTPPIWLRGILNLLKERNQVYQPVVTQ